MAVKPFYMGACSIKSWVDGAPVNAVAIELLLQFFSYLAGDHDFINLFRRKALCNVLVDREQSALCNNSGC